MMELKPINKGATNEAQGFKFRSIDQVYTALNPLLSKHGVFFVPRVLEREFIQTPTEVYDKYNKVTLKKVMNRTILLIEYTFYASDGSHVKCVSAGEAMDSGDKATSKAMSIALKYALFQTFCIPTEDEAKNDPDAYSPQVEAPKQPKQEIAQISKEKALFLRDNLDEETAVKYRERFNVKFLSKITDADFDKIIKETSLLWGKK